MKIPFIKMHGLGNDFVIIDERVQEYGLSPPKIAQIADRHYGVGCDQLVILRSAESADIHARFFNSDGSESGACGNATRCIAFLLFTENQKIKTAFKIKTLAGILETSIDAAKENDGISVVMGIPKNVQQNFNVQNFQGTAVDMGNPHFVTIVEDINEIDIAKIGKALELDPIFPHRSNIEFVEIINLHHVRMRVWERGAGVTLACGSGACAVAVALIEGGNCVSPVVIQMDGGVLEIFYNNDSNKIVTMKGAARFVFEGVFTLS